MSFRKGFRELIDPELFGATLATFVTVFVLAVTFKLIWILLFR